MYYMNAVMDRYNTLPLVNTGAILFTIEVLSNLLLGVRGITG
jgi:hypothetical protein